MKKITLALPVVLLVAALSGCSSPGTVSEGSSSRSKLDRIDAVTQTGRQAAVLSLHTRTSFENACKYGMTLTNNLPYKIKNIAFRFDAYINGGVLYRQETKNFWELDPTESQYRDMTFSGVTCDQIDYIQVHDPGRCAMGKLTRFSSGPGDCMRYVDIPSTTLVRLVRK